MSSICSGVEGPVFPAISFVPARMIDHLRLQMDHILPEAQHHLRRRLPADAAIDIRLAGEALIEVPALGDRVAHEDHALLARRRRPQLCVLVLEARKIGEIRKQLLVVLAPVLVVGVSRGRKLRRRFRLRNIARLLRVQVHGHQCHQQRPQPKSARQIASRRVSPRMRSEQAVSKVRYRL